MKKLIRTISLLSVMALMMGACQENKKDATPSEPDPVVPDSTEEFKLPEKYEDAKFFNFAELDKVEEEEFNYLIGNFEENLSKLEE